MNTNPHDLNAFESAPESVSSPAEETLRLIASLPAPDGLENRMNAALSAAKRRGRVLAWPSTFGLTLRPESGWMRTAAAAAIVFVVAGGGWGVYSRVDSLRAGQPARVIVMPPRMPAPGGFSGAGAIRTPVTLPGPAVPQPDKATTAPPNMATKPLIRLKPTPRSSGHPKAARNAASQPDAPR